MNWSPQPRGSRMEPWDAEALAASYPYIQWREPVHVNVPGVGEGYMCRICTANRGFNAKDVDSLPKTREGFAAHMAEEHPCST